MGIDRNINREYWNKSRFYYPIFFWPRISKVVSSPRIYPWNQSKIENRKSSRKSIYLAQVNL